MPQDEMGEDVEGGRKARACTDILCLVLFIGALVYLGFIFSYMSEHSDLRRIYHGIDFYGNLCGVDAVVSDSPYLFWCAVPDHASTVQLPGGASGELLYSPTSQLDLAHPICVQSCPSMDLGAHSCYQGSAVVDETPNADTGTFTQSVTYNFLAVGDYNTTSVAFRYCMPTSFAMHQAVLGAVHNDFTQYSFLAFSEVGRSWSVLIMAALVAVGLGYAYLYLLETAAGPVLYTCFAVAIFIPFAFGMAMLLTAYMPNVHIFSTGHTNADIVIGAGLVLLSLILLLIYIFIRKSLQLSIKCVQYACECMFHMPTMLFEPLLSLCIKMFLFVVLMIGLFSLISCGDVEQFDIHQIVPSGLGRKFVYSESEKYYLAFYLFMTFWLLELCTACSQFSLAYAVQLWYFRDPKKRVPRFPTIQGYTIGITYHLGSLAFGAFLLALTRFIRVILSCLLGKEKEKSNSVKQCILSCASCLVTCFEKFIRFLNKNAYMSMALESKPFCEAAQHALQVMGSQAIAIAILNGACWVFMLTGVLAITCLGVFFTWLLIVTLPVFANEGSPYYVADPMIVAGASSLICAIIAVSFMVVFDTVADTMLFCLAMTPQVEELRRKAGKPRKVEQPSRLQEATNFVREEPQYGS